MKRLQYLLLALTFMLVMSFPASVRAESVLPATLVINEIQTNGPGSGTTLQEFIELTNVSVSPVFITGWEVRYTNSSGTDYLLYKFPEITSVEPQEKLLLIPTTAPSDFLATITPKIAYTPPTSSGIAATAGTVTLVTNSAVQVDSVSWVNSAAAAAGEKLYYTGGGKSLQRKISNNSSSVSGLSADDFEVLDVPTPESGIPLPPPLEEDDPPTEPELPPADTPPTDPPVTEDPEGEPPQTTPPAEEPTVKKYENVYINELYIDPVSPETDANNEWVELYNPGQNNIELAGYILASGATFSYTYVFPSGLSIPAGGFVVVSSADTTIALSNGGGAVKITDPTGGIMDTAVYGEAPPGQAWAKNGTGQWEWTTTPTSMAGNIITAPLPAVIKTAAVKVAKAKKASTAKKTSVKAATSKAAKTKTAKVSTIDEPALIAAPTPIPGWLLAILVSLALLYVGYEYRFEARNTIYKLRNNRSARR